MKAKVFNLIKTLVDVKSEFRENIILPSGSVGCVVECYENPEGYAVDLEIPDASLVGGLSYDNVILYPEQFEVVNKWTIETSPES